MAADLHIHIFEGIVEADLAKFCSNHLGSKWFNPRPGATDFGPGSVFHRVSETPNIWVGEVSWLKAALFDDDSYVPNPVGAINDLIGEELPVLDDALIEAIGKAVDLKNETGYRLGNAEDILAFLRLHKGKKVFTVSW